MSFSDYEPVPQTALDRASAALLGKLVRTDADPTPSELGAYSGDDPRGYLEGVLHEICHVVVLRGGIRAALRRPLPYHVTIGEAVPRFPEIRIRRNEPILLDAERDAAVIAANDHEIATIATEVLASQELGLPFHPLDIAVFAVDGENVKNLGGHEQVAKLIESAMKRRDVRRWGRDLGRHLLSASEPERS